MGEIINTSTAIEAQPCGDAVHRFASIGNPETRMFMEKMDEMIQIYNRTEQICFDDKKIYLLPKKLAV